jgi:hypothetical protein
VHAYFPNHCVTLCETDSDIVTDERGRTCFSQAKFGGMLAILIAKQIMLHCFFRIHPLLNAISTFPICCGQCCHEIFMLCLILFGVGDNLFAPPIAFLLQAKVGGVCGAVD